MTKQRSVLESSIWKVFEVFIDEPTKIHYIKEISRIINLAPTSIRKHLENLEKENIISKKKGDQFNGFIANRDDNEFIFYKKIYNLLKIKKSGLIDEIVNSMYPKTIILYGSYMKGEDLEQSDIDILTISKVKKEINLEKFEKILRRKIHLITEKDISRLNKNLRLEILNGLVLYGYLKNE